MEAVQAEEALDELVFAETRERGYRPIAELIVHDRENAFETVAVDRDDGSNELLCPTRGPGAAFVPRRNPQAVRLPGRSRDRPYPNGAIGEWTVSILLSSPRYMCTPQGKHGSKLRTARMMSMPLNASGPFSSRIGVFCTASS